MMQWSSEEKEKVSLLQCAPTVEDAEVVQRTQEAIEQLGNWHQGLGAARSIAVKINAGVDRLTRTQGRQTELTEPAVIEGTVRALRAVTDAEIIIGDAATHRDSWSIYERLGLTERLAKYPRVRLFDFNDSELAYVEMPHEDAMFRRYHMPREVVEADAVVSVSKMKAHVSMGCTLCIKNLFGWMPTAIYGEPRMYLHDRLIRLPRVLSDIARTLKPRLNVVDGIVAASKSEWGGDAVVPGVIVAGTNIVATDSIGARVMGFDPQGDYPDFPFFYRRNVIKLAAEAGLGPNDASQIEVLGPEPESIVTPFEVRGYGGNTRRAEQLRDGAACVAAYQEQQAALAREFGGRFLAMRDGKVLWDGATMNEMIEKEHQSGRNWESAPQFVVRCVMPEEEIENFGWYDFEAAAQPELVAV
jgi:uncharacterized protein (DUF362 family)